MSSGSGGEDDAMRLAFEQYMMSTGGGNANANTNRGTKPIMTKEDEKKEKQRKHQETKLQLQKQLTTQMKKSEKRYWQIFTKFSKKLEGDWLDIDDQAYQVVQAIVGLRNRLPMQAKLLNKWKDENHSINAVGNGTQHKIGRKDWSQSGFHNAFMTTSSTSIHTDKCIPSQHQHRDQHLSKGDVQLALSHDLIQHEKMMSSLRGLFATLSDSHEMILRNLDEMTKFHLECVAELDHEMNAFDEFMISNDCTIDSDRDNDSDSDSGVPMVNVSFESMKYSPSFLRASGLASTMNDIVAMLSRELYRKQCMVHIILNSVDDELLDRGGGDVDVDVDVDWEDLSPQQAVDRCCKQWPRQSKNCCIDARALSFALMKE